MRKPDPVEVLEKLKASFDTKSNPFLGLSPEESRDKYIKALTEIVKELDANRNW